MGAAAGDPVRVMITVTAVRGGEMAEVESTVDVLESATGGGPRITVPSAPRNLLADATDGAVTLMWEAPADDGGAAITDYEYRIGRSGPSLPAEATPIAQVVLDLAHFANGAGIISEVVLVNVAPHPIRPALYFYDQEGEPIAAESMVDVTGDLEITEDGALSIQSEMEPLGELTISTYGRGELVSGSVRVVSDGPHRRGPAL